MKPLRRTTKGRIGSSIVLQKRMIEDATGTPRTYEEVRTVFMALHHKNPKQCKSLFPLLNEGQYKRYVKHFGLDGEVHRAFTEAEEDLIRSLYPDYAKIQKQIPDKTRIALEKKCQHMGLSKGRKGRAWTKDEVDILLATGSAPGRSVLSCNKKLEGLGIQKRRIKSNRSREDLYGLIRSIVPRTLPLKVRDEVEADIALQCLEGKIQADAKAIRAAVKQAITAVYRMHPDRGAPTSLDAQIYDDGGTTVGDRISSDAFHF